LRNENLKVGRALRRRIYGAVGKDQGRTGRDDCLCLVQEGSWQPAFLRGQKNTLMRFALFSGCHFRPTQMSVYIGALKRAKTKSLRGEITCGFGIPARPISTPFRYIDCLVRTAYNHRNWAGVRLIRVPIKLASCDRLTLLTALGKEQTGVHCCSRRGVLVRNDNGRALHCNSEEELGKFERKADTSVRIGIARKVAGMQGDPAPGHALHVRHFCALVDSRSVMHLFFQNGEDAGRSRMTRPSSADAWSRDADIVAINVGHLLRDTGDDQKRSFGRALRFPDILPGLQSYSVRRDSDTLGESFGTDKGAFESEQRRNEDKDFMTVNVQVTSPRDASGRPRMSILFDVEQIGLAVLGSRFGPYFSIVFSQISSR